MDTSALLTWFKARGGAAHEFVWVPHEEHVFVLAHITDRHEDQNNKAGAEPVLSGELALPEATTPRGAPRTVDAIPLARTQEFDLEHVERGVADVAQVGGGRAVVLAPRLAAAAADAAAAAAVATSRRRWTPPQTRAHLPRAPSRAPHTQPSEHGRVTAERCALQQVNNLNDAPLLDIVRRRFFEDQASDSSPRRRRSSSLVVTSVIVPRRRRGVAVVVVATAAVIFSLRSA